MTQQNLVSGRNHLTCAFHTSGHILGLSTRLSPSLTISHPHIKFRAAIPQAQLTHLIFLFFLMWPLLELSSRLSSRFHISEGLTPVSTSLSHIYLTNIHSIHNMFNFTFQQSFSLPNTSTSHFNHHIMLNSQTNNSHHVYSQFIPHRKFMPSHI